MLQNSLLVLFHNSHPFVKLETETRWSLVFSLILNNRWIIQGYRLKSNCDALVIDLGSNKTHTCVTKHVHTSFTFSTFTRYPLFSQSDDLYLKICRAMVQQWRLRRRWRGRRWATWTSSTMSPSTWTSPSTATWTSTSPPRDRAPRPSSSRSQRLVKLIFSFSWDFQFNFCLFQDIK